MERNNSGQNSTDPFGMLSNSNHFEIAGDETACSMSNLKTLEEIMIHVGCGQDSHSFVFSSFPLESGTTCQDSSFDERVMLRLNLDKAQIILNCQWKQRLWTEIKPSFLCNDMVTFCNSEDMEWILSPQTICLWNDSIYTLKIKHTYAVLFMFQDVMCAIVLIYNPGINYSWHLHFFCLEIILYFFANVTSLIPYELLILVALLISFKYKRKSPWKWLFY